MKTIIIIFKAVLLWGTAISIFAFLCGGCEHLMEVGKTPIAVVWLMLNIAFVFYCATTLNVRDVLRVTGKYWLDKHLKF